jgi:two-component system chemotaxis sensor kinase CheA
LNLEKYRILFVDEAHEHLAEMSRALGELDGEPDAAREAVDTLFRMTHSIKGMAASLDYLSVSTLSHRLEDWLEPMRARGGVPDEGTPLLYDVVRALEEMVQVVERTGAPPPHREDLLAQLAVPLPELRALEPASPTADDAAAHATAVTKTPPVAERAGGRPPTPEKKAQTPARRHRCHARCACAPRPSTAFSRPSVT